MKKNRYNSTLYYYTVSDGVIVLKSDGKSLMEYNEPYHSLLSEITT